MLQEFVVHVFVVPSPNVTTDEETGNVLSTKEEIQVIRDHYGENWLQVMAAKNEETLASSASSRDIDKTEDDIYLNESIANISVSSQQKSIFHEEVDGSTEVKRSPQDLLVGGSTNVKVTRKEADDDIEVLPEPAGKIISRENVFFF